MHFDNNMHVCVHACTQTPPHCRTQTQEEREQEGNLIARGTKNLVHHHFIHSLVPVFHALADDHALACAQPTGLHHDRRACLCDVRLGLFRLRGADVRRRGHLRWLRLVSLARCVCAHVHWGLCFVPAPARGRSNTAHGACVFGAWLLG